ncbi:hypothetical protein [Streptomyces sp. NBC_00081]|uniref:hypothetical protein n=1 Tax=Streptomyces sp. NBC_00081 TaxID=2975646 RepID=UPI003246F73A
MVGVDKPVDTRKNLTEEDPSRVHGLARHVYRVRFADSVRHLHLHLLEFFRFAVCQDPA